MLTSLSSVCCVTRSSSSFRGRLTKTLKGCSSFHIFFISNIKLSNSRQQKYILILMHLADAFIQSDLQCIQAVHLYCQYVCSLGIEPTTFALLTQCSTTESQEHYIQCDYQKDGASQLRLGEFMNERERSVTKWCCYISVCCFWKSLTFLDLP